MNSQGNATIAVLILVFALSAMFLSAAAFSGSVARLLLGLNGQEEEQALLAAEARKTIDLMCQDPTPEADSPLDPVWEEIALPSIPDTVVTLTDLSSRINPNSALDYLLASVNAFQEGKPYESFHKFRVEAGPLVDFKHTCAEYFKEETIDKFLTEYSFFNVNTANESMLYQMFETRTGTKATSTPFATKIRNKRLSKALFTQKDMKGLLAADLDTVYPYLSALPEMNVNLMDPDLLGAVLAMAKNIYKVELKGDPKNAILTLRAGTEITQERLVALIQPKFKGTILEAYLGCRTWFWGITVKRGNLIYRAVAVRLPAPPDGADKAVRYRMIDEIFTTESEAPVNNAEETVITNE